MILLVRVGECPHELFADVLPPRKLEFLSPCPEKNGSPVVTPIAFAS